MSTNHGGALKGADANKKIDKAGSAKGQQKIFGAGKPKKKEAPLSVDESRRRKQEEEGKAQQREEARRLREENDRIAKEEWEKERKKKEEEALATLRRLAEDAEQQTREFGTDDDLEDSDDEDDEDYVDEDNDNDDKDDAENMDRRMFKPGKKRQKTKPPKDSTLEKYLTNMQDAIMSGGELENGQQWFPPECDPLSTNDSRAPDPADWYSSKFWIYAFHSQRQYKHVLGDHFKKKCSCIRCGQEGSLESHGLAWRLFHWFHLEVLCLHPRMRCKDCKATFAVIDP